MIPCESFSHPMLSVLFDETMVGHSSQINIESRQLTCPKLHIESCGSRNSSIHQSKQNNIQLQKHGERRLKQQEATLTFTQGAIEEENILVPQTSEEQEVEVNSQSSYTSEDNHNNSAVIELNVIESKRFDECLEQRRTRRLLAMFHLWQSKTEMNQQVQRDRNSNCTRSNASRRERATRDAYFTTLSDNLTQQSTSSSCTHHHNHITRHNHLMLIPTSTTNMPFATSIMPDNLSESLSERKLWQSLVMPLILGCIIFSVVIWTRQISLVLMDDTIVMIVILGTVFILMSGIAFWLAQDQSMMENNCDEEQQRADLSSNHQNCSSATDEQTRHHNCRYQHHTSNSNHNNNKRCNVSIIECQPPDYYSAMKNSYPVGIYTKESAKEYALELANINPNTDLKHLAVQQIDSNNSPAELDPPPSYQEWSSSRKCGGSHSMANHSRQ